MELPRAGQSSQIGRRSSVAVDPASPRVGYDEAQSTAIGGAVPSSPFVAASPYLGAPPSPNLSRETHQYRPQRPHERKNSRDGPGPSPNPQTGGWSTWFGGAAAGPSPALPSYGGPIPGSGRVGQRPFYSERTPAAKPPLIILVRNTLLRPIYLISRRGPILPLIGAVLLILIYLTYSTSPRSQSVILRVQGAVGPYIPERAANAIKWRGKQRQWGVADGFDAPVPGKLPKAVGPGVGGGVPIAGGATKAPQDAVLGPKRRDGRILLEEGKIHPIPALMRKAKEDWEELKGRQSKTFAEAVREYVKRYGRRPPAGFDKWYAFAKAHKVLLIDEFDLIDKDLLMYRAFKPSNFRTRVEHLATTFDTIWTIRVEKGKLIREGQLANHARAMGVVSLSERFAHMLPDMKIVFNGHDGARISVASEERTRLETLARNHEYDEDSEAPFWPKLVGPEPHWGMPIFCPPGSAVREPGFDYGWAAADSTGLEMPPVIEGSSGALVDNFKGYMDVCNSPQYRHFHCTTSWVYSHHPTPVMPLFTPGVQATFGDIHGLIVEQLELEAQHDPTWEERPFTSLQWRGQTSGPLWESATPWRSTQRARLHLLSHQETGSRKIILTDGNDQMRVEEVPNYRLNPLFLDTGMVGPAVQCVKEDGTCDEMYKVFQGYDKRISFDRASLYKYVLDVDGNSWSGRMRRLMLSNAAVVKATIFPEFWTDWAIPWLHFIPMQVDYSDMWDIMAFFRGGINGEGAHDDLGKEIAQAGKEWVKLCYRWADLEAYQFRLMLEYGRLYNDETAPGSNDFNGDESTEPVFNGPVKLR